MKEKERSQWNYFKNNKHFFDPFDLLFHVIYNKAYVAMNIIWHEKFQNSFWCSVVLLTWATRLMHAIFTIGAKPFDINSESYL